MLKWRQALGATLHVEVTRDRRLVLFYISYAYPDRASSAGWLMNVSVSSDKLSEMIFSKTIHPKMAELVVCTKKQCFVSCNFTFSKQFVLSLIDLCFKFFV